MRRLELGTPNNNKHRTIFHFNMNFVDTHLDLVGQEWFSFLKEGFDYAEEKIYPKLRKLKREKNKTILPVSSKIYRAFKECPLDKVKVVILGQDPYHTPGMATGLAFDNIFIHNRVKSPSLKNILAKLLEGESQWSQNKTSALEHLPPQGVLLINTALTVEMAAPDSHTKLWAPFTENLIRKLNTKDNLCWILWGSKALQYKDLITNETHEFVISSHPSPLSANRPLQGYPSFKDSNPFIEVNKKLERLNQTPIKW